MPDLITFVQKVYGRVRSRHLFDFRRELYTQEGPRPDPLRDKQTRLGMKFGTRWFSRKSAGVPGRIHLHDSMLQNDSPREIANYARVGLSARENIEAALHAAGLEYPRIGACLDMACGYGRVLRRLVERIPPEKITACEVMPEAVRFLQEEFGVKPLVSPRDLKTMQFPEKYDLIWVGSLFTHLIPDDGMRFMELLIRSLNPCGVLVFSTQGKSCLEFLSLYGSMFKDKTEQFRQQLETTGAAYLPYYENAPDYGITLFTPEYIQDHLVQTFGPGVRRVRYAAQGWDNHQDVHAFQNMQ